MSEKDISNFRKLFFANILALFFAGGTAIFNYAALTTTVDEHIAWDTRSNENTVAIQQRLVIQQAQTTAQIEALTEHIRIQGERLRTLEEIHLSGRRP